MSTLPVLDDLPDGYFVEESPRGILVLHADVARELHEAGFGPESDGRLARSDLEGRKPLFRIDTDDESFVVRRFSHGGLMRWITGERFLDAERPFRELILSDSLLRVGIPTPRVVAARAQMSAGVGWQLEVMTRRVEEALDLGYVLGRARRGEVPPASRSRILRAFGDLVRRMHAHGLLHADLQPNNVLVNASALEGAEPELWLLDLDRSYFKRELGDGERRANLRRLFRHVRRREDHHGEALSRTDYARFLRGYDPDGTRWKRDWRAVLTLHGIGRGFHRFGWLLERLFAETGDPRANGGARPAEEESDREAPTPR